MNKVKTIKITFNEDWKTAVALNQESIPANTELTLLGILTNFYGTYLKVRYKGSLYYIDPRNVEYLE